MSGYVVNVLKGRYDPGRCRYCKAPIKWAVSDNKGAKLPIDAAAEPVRSFVTTPEGLKFDVFVAASLHFATCPVPKKDRR